MAACQAVGRVCWPVRAPSNSLLGARNKTSWEPVNNERKTLFSGGASRECACRREEPQRHGGHGEGVRPLPLCFKRLNKNVVLLGALEITALF